MFLLSRIKERYERTRDNDEAVVFGLRSTAGIITGAAKADTARTDAPPEPYVQGELTINYDERRVYLAGGQVQLTDLEYRFLVELAVNAGRVMTHEDLLRRVWGPAHPGHSGPIRTVVKNLRSMLGDQAENPTFILNEPRVGYRMERVETTD